MFLENIPNYKFTGECCFGVLAVFEGGGPGGSNSSTSLFPCCRPLPPPAGLFWMFMGVANSDNKLYDDEMAAIAAAYPDQFRLDYALSREQARAPARAATPVVVGAGVVGWGCGRRRAGPAAPRCATAPARASPLHPPCSPFSRCSPAAPLPL